MLDGISDGPSLVPTRAFGLVSNRLSRKRTMKPPEEVVTKSTPHVPRAELKPVSM